MTENFTKIPRPEHPNPQFERSRWQNLNGLWDFEFDFGTTGLERKLYENPQFTKQILVPFCPESQLSGIGYTDFIPCCWYHRSFTIHAEDLNGAVYLHFGAVDYEAHVFINGQEAGTHKGGYTSFQVEISALLKEGENDLTVCAIDHPLEGKQPSTSIILTVAITPVPRASGRQFGWNSPPKHTSKASGISPMWQKTAW